jgi:hypothetical protein
MTARVPKFDRRIERLFYSRSTDRLRIIFDDRTIYVIPRRLLEGLEDASTEQLKRIEILEKGPTLEWPLLGITHSVPRLLEGIYGGRRWMASLDRRPETISPRSEARAAEKAVSKRARRLLGDEFVVMTNSAKRRRASES